MLKGYQIWLEEPGWPKFSLVVVKGQTASVSGQIRRHFDQKYFMVTKSGQNIANDQSVIHS